MEHSTADPALFARYLDVGLGVLSEDERDETHRQGATPKLLSLVHCRDFGTLAQHLPEVEEANSSWA